MIGKKVLQDRIWSVSTQKEAKVSAWNVSSLSFKPTLQFAWLNCLLSALFIFIFSHLHPKNTKFCRWKAAPRDRNWSRRRGSWRDSFSARRTAKLSRILAGENVLLVIFTAEYHILGRQETAGDREDKLLRLHEEVVTKKKAKLVEKQLKEDKCKFLT